MLNPIVLCDLIIFFISFSYLFKFPFLYLGIMNGTALGLLLVRVLFGFLQLSREGPDMGQTASQAEPHDQQQHQQQQQQQQQQQHQPSQHRQKKGTTSLTRISVKLK